MELFEAGYLTERTGGIPIRFGDAATMVRLAEMTGKNEGFGAIGYGLLPAGRKIWPSRTFHVRKETGDAGL